MFPTQFPEVLKSCRTPRFIHQARKIHALIISTGCSSSLFTGNTLLNAYLNCGFLNDARRVFRGISAPNVFSWNIMITGLSKLGLLDDARQVFDEMPTRDSASWNTLMSGYFRNGQFMETINTFILMMRGQQSIPNLFTLNCAMKACGALQSYELGLQLHGFVEKCDFRKDPQVEGSLVDMHVKCGSVEMAAGVFELSTRASLFCWNSMIIGYSKLAGVARALETFYKMPERDVVSWNTMISVLSQHGLDRETLYMVMKMHDNGYLLNSTTYTCALSACTSIGDLDWGQQLHARIVRCEPRMDMFVGSALVDMYAKYVSLEAAKVIFDSLTEYNAVSWTVLIRGFAERGRVEEALSLFSQMRGVPVAPDEYTLATVITACCVKDNINNDIGELVPNLICRIFCTLMVI